MAMTEKPWGKEEIVELNRHYMVKKLYIKRGERTSLHYHPNKIETFQVLEGEAMVSLWKDHDYSPQHDFDIDYEHIDIDSKSNPLTVGQGMKHRIYAKTDCVVLEMSTAHTNDTVRLKDDYSRDRNQP